MKKIIILFVLIYTGLASLAQLSNNARSDNNVPLPGHPGTKPKPPCILKVKASSLSCTWSPCIYTDKAVDAKDIIKYYHRWPENPNNPNGCIIQKDTPKVTFEPTQFPLPDSAAAYTGNIVVDGRKHPYDFTLINKNFKRVSKVVPDFSGLIADLNKKLSDAFGKEVSWFEANQKTSTTGSFMVTKKINPCEPCGEKYVYNIGGRVEFNYAISSDAFIGDFFQYNVKGAPHNATPVARAKVKLKVIFTIPADKEQLGSCTAEPNLDFDLAASTFEFDANTIESSYTTSGQWEVSAIPHLQTTGNCSFNFKTSTLKDSIKVSLSHTFSVIKMNAAITD